MDLLRFTQHRPYPPEKGPWIAWQRWQYLLFAHWAVPVEVLRPKIPGGLEIDTVEGQAWVGVIPFRIAITARGLHQTLLKRRFHEINVRTYVTLPGGKHPGVWFFSLDASDPISVWGASTFYKLPYFNARIACRVKDNEVLYRSSRRHEGSLPADFEAIYRPSGPVFNAQPGSLEYWLTERYCLYTQSRRGRLFRAEIHHPPWPLQAASSEISVNTMATSQGIALPDSDPHLLYAANQEMVTWPLKPV